MGYNLRLKCIQKMIKRKTCIEEGCTQPVWARKRCKYHDSTHHPQKHGLLKPSSETSSEGVQTPKKRKRIAPVSEKQAQRLKEYRKLRDAYMEVHRMCEVRGCNRPSEDLHHMLPRAYHLLDTDVFMAVCRECHCRIEREDKWARENGYKLNHLSN